jgi:polar amino acid transport system substrate-binding protein
MSFKPPRPLMPSRTGISRRLALAQLLSFAACSPDKTSEQPPEKAPELTSMAAPSAAWVTSPDLSAHGMLLPGLVDSAKQGGFIELIRAIDAIYTQGQIQVEVFPVGRVYQNIKSGLCDFAFPTLRMSPALLARAGHTVSTRSFGQVAFVLYSHRTKGLTREKLESAAQRSARESTPFPYHVIAAPVMEVPYPTSSFTNFESALQMVNAGHADAFLWAQEEVDLVLQRLDLPQVQRSLYGMYEDVFLLPLGERGRQVDDILSRCLDQLSAEGQLPRLYSGIHRPYKDWQTRP